MLKDFEHHVKNIFPELLSEPFLLACSGGVDSVVLAHLCAALQLDFSLAHTNFQLRGNASDEDQEFVRNLATGFNKKFFTTNFDTESYIRKNKVSIQMAARELRYAWFTEIMFQNRIKWLVTAHHSDDNLETFLINLSRGTGIQGLSGIPAKTETIARPLLPFSRARIMEYAKRNRLQWSEDASNADIKYLRNKIRHNVVPILKELHPTFEKNFKDTQSFLADSASILEVHGLQLRKELFEPLDGETIRISVERLGRLRPRQAYLHLIFKDFGFTAWKDVAALLEGQSGKEVRSGTYRLVKDRGQLLLQKIQEGDDQIYYIEEKQKKISHPFQLTIERVSTIGELSSNTLYVDQKTLKYPLTVRKWQKGDYFHPLGMKGRKKVSKYFKDEKVNKFAKEKQWFLCSDNQIVWVIGRRGDNRFKVQENSDYIIKFEVNQ